MDPRPLLTHPAVQQARSQIVESDRETIDEQLGIVAIPAPSFLEAARAEHMAARMRALGLAHVHLDDVGNVLSRLPAARSRSGAPVVVAAHLDTVFPADTDVAPRFVGNRIHAPGITDNSRGLAALLAVAQAIIGSKLMPTRPVHFVGTVGEEGNGDLRGTKHLFRTGGPLSRPHAFISLDGSGIRRIVHRAIGARRLRITFQGPGGHSWSDWGTVNPLHALGRFIAGVLQHPLPTQPPVTLTVAKVEGGTNVNMIPVSAWLELDVRSEFQAALGEAEARARALVAQLLDSENASRRAGTCELSATIEVIGDRPSGSTGDDSPLVTAAIAATRIVGARPELVASSTDANVPMSLGIPAITLGAGGESGGIHTCGEWYCNREGARGLDRALLTVLAAAGVE